MDILSGDLVSDELDVNALIGDCDVEMLDDELKKELEEIDNEENKQAIKNEINSDKLDVKTEVKKEVVDTNDTSRSSSSSSSDKSNKIRNEKDYQKNYDLLTRRDVRDIDMFKEHLIDFKRLKKAFNFTKNTDPFLVGREIAYRLHEPKMKLFGNVVIVLGVELSLEIFEETKKIILKGGLKTDSGDRKRSPGGTYLYLMKSRGYASKRQMKEIFKFENEGKKRAKQRLNKNKKIYSKHQDVNIKKEPYVKENSNTTSIDIKQESQDV